MGIESIARLASERAAGAPRGITSICTAHPTVIETALLHGKRVGSEVLIEATCNQVNQAGGYTGMQPADFRTLVEGLAERTGFDRARLIFGGDHLGPNPWKHLPADEAMARAEAMIGAYVKAGFTKLHLDASMGCRGEPPALPDEITAERAARLAAVAERADENLRPCYVVGTEVPVPGGTIGTAEEMKVTSPAAALQTLEVHRKAFAAAGAERAFERTVALVVQPGVEFGNSEVVRYRTENGRELSAALRRIPQFVFEVHSTDYQSQQALRALVEDGFAILKVGPGLTFALREALYGLDQIARALDPAFAAHGLASAMERLMLSEPGHWAGYCQGTDSERRIQRHFSYSDRIRYYWPHAEARRAVRRLLEFFRDRPIPEPLIGQFLAASYPEVAEGLIPSDPRGLIRAAVERVLKIYHTACQDEGSMS